MASLDSLPPDQRAVLQLVLQRGRSYDQIAAMLSIDRAAVRDRALSAFDSIGPQTRVEPARRALITDYLMGQLPPRVAEQVRDRLATSAPERAWARVLAAELAPLARGPLPEIPSSAAAQRPADGAAAAADAAREPRRGPTAVAASERAGDAVAVADSGAGAGQSGRGANGEPGRGPGGEPGRGPGGESGRGAGGLSGRSANGESGYGLRDPESSRAQASSRRGGAILIGLGVIVAAVVVIIVLITGSGGSSPKHSRSIAQSSTPGATTPANTTSTPTTGTSSTGTQVIGQLTLASPTGAKTPIGGAEVVKQGTKEGIVIAATGMPANTKHNAYAVWLYNSPSDGQLLGFVNPAVKSDGKLQTAGVLPANAAHYKELLVTVETRPKPKAPGQVVLQGALGLK